MPWLQSDTFVWRVLCVALVCLLVAPHETINCRQKAHLYPQIPLLLVIEEAEVTLQKTLRSHSEGPFAALP